MVLTQQKTMSSEYPVASPVTESNTVTQTELPSECVVIQVSGCTVCPSFLSVSDGSSEYVCGRYAQVELLSLVTELWEEVGRLRSIRESKNEIDWCNHTLSSLR